MLKKKTYPFLSFVIPTLNSQRTLELCLQSINAQVYQGKTEIIIADGGSTDDTLKIAKQYRARVVKNLLKTGEAGKAVGALNAKGEILAFVDSDNILPEKDWSERMVEPFLDLSDVVASEPLNFTYRSSDHWLTRYFALLGMGDPLNLFTGDYDRYSYVTNRWTDLDIKTKNHADYIILTLTNDLPTIGANGFLIKKIELKKYPVKDYLFDIDVLRFLAGDNSIKVAKVKTGIVHLFSGDISTFIRKQRRRIRDFLHFKKTGIRVGQPNPLRLYFGVIRFTLSCALIIPLLIQAFSGFRRRADLVWLFHPAACLITLYVYGWELLKSPFVTGAFNRDKWSQ